MVSYSRYAYYGKENKIMHICEITRETTGRVLGSSLVCLDCGKQMQASLPRSEKTAETYAPRFQHVAGEICSGNSGETILHIKAKELIARYKKLYVPSYVWAVKKPHKRHRSLRGLTEKDFDKEFDADLYREDEVNAYDYLIETVQQKDALMFEDVRLESREGSFIPDCIATDKDGNKIYIEIYVTHATEYKKVEWFVNENKTAIEIDISGLYSEYKTISSDEQEKEADKKLKAAVIYQTENKEWIHHENIDEPVDLYGKLFKRYMAYSKKIAHTEQKDYEKLQKRESYEKRKQEELRVEAHKESKGSNQIAYFVEGIEKNPSRQSINIALYHFDMVPDTDDVITARKQILNIAKNL